MAEETDPWTAAGFKPVPATEDPWTAAGFRPVQDGKPDDWRPVGGGAKGPWESDPIVSQGNASAPWESDPVTGPGQPIDDWQPVGPEKVPEAFLDRVRAGQQMQRILAAATAGAKEGFGDATRTGLSDETIGQLIDLGIFHDPMKGRPGPIHFLNEAMILPTASAFDTIMRAVNAGIHGAGSAIGQLHEELGASQGTAERARKEVINAGNWALIESGFGRFSRPAIGPGGAIDQAIGGLPKAEDFKVGAEVLKAPEAEPRLRELWQEQGIHPAEAVHDAQTDAWLKHQLAAPRAEPEPIKLPADLTAAEAEQAGLPAAVGAEVTSEPPLIPLAQQPAPAPGKLVAMAKDAADRLFDAARDLQMKVAPMATGTTESMAVTKDFANATRRNRWEWSRIDADIEQRFTPEQRTRMFNAMDEESVAIQLGEPREHQGLATLTPEERATVVDLDNRQQVAWLRAIDTGLVQGEGIPMHAPRMVLNIANAGTGDGAIPLNGLGRNLRVKTPGMRHREYMTVEETEAAAKKAFGEQAVVARDIRAVALSTAQLEDAIAGRSLIDNIKEAGRRSGDETVAEFKPTDSEHKWFTLDHPAFRTWRPKFERAANGDPLLEGNMLKTVKDAEGNIIFEQTQLYIRGDYEGPLRAVLTRPDGAFYSALMEMKGKTMSLIMNSPLIHNMVILGKVMPAFPGKAVTGRLYFQGNRAKNDIGLMTEAIDNGLVPIGRRFFNQDISSIMESPDLTPGRSWTAKVVGMLPHLDAALPDVVPGKFTAAQQAAASARIKTAIDKAGDFWHNTLLWDRIGDLQMGVYVNLRDRLAAKGVDQQTSSRVAAQFANRMAGSIPQEAMSEGARKFLNFALFSRSFTSTNIATFKDAITGLPRDLAAQIERDTGAVNPAALSEAKSLARRKAAAIIGVDIALYYIGNSILQNIANVMFNDSTLDAEMHGYAKRLSEALEKRAEHPLSILQPLDFVESLSATSENEPGRKDRIKIGYSKDGQAIYARNPVGKYAEELISYMTGPLDIMRRKQGTIARPALQIWSNDKGFGRKIYDPTADTIPSYVDSVARVAAHMLLAQTPEGQIRAGADLVKGEGDKYVNAAQAFGPVAGVTFSRGAPGGPAVGEMYHARQQHQFAVDVALPDIRRQIQRGDIVAAQERMRELGVPPGLQNFYIRTTLNPATRLSPRALRDFYLYSTPEQRQRLERAR